MGAYDDFSRVGEAAVLEAGRYLRANLGRTIEASYKGAVDLVTPFDVGAQEILVGRLAAAFPGHGFLAEEGLSRTGSSDCRWIIDPLDGTTNFAHAFPVFSVSAALECAGRLVLGFVYDPMREELFRAEAARGAFLNGAPVRVSGVSDLGKSLLATGFPYDVRMNPVNNLDHWGRFIIRAQAIRRCGSAALDLCLCRLRPLRRILGAQAQTVGRGCGGPDRRRGRRRGHRFRRGAVRADVPGNSGFERTHPPGHRRGPENRPAGRRER